MLFRWGRLTLYAYPTLLYIGLVAGVAAGHALAASAGLDADAVTLATVLLICPALIGARLLFLALNWRSFAADPVRLWSRSDGGAALYGGLALSLVISPLVLGWLRLAAGAFWDVAAVTILVGMVFTKIGCLLNGCCGGRPTDGWLALPLANARGIRKRRVPTQLLESALAAALLLGLAAVWRWRGFDGEVFLIALGGYGLGRSVLEPFKESTDRIGRVSVHQAISVLLVAFSVTCLLVRAR